MSEELYDRLCEIHEMVYQNQLDSALRALDYLMLEVREIINETE